MLKRIMEAFIKQNNSKVTFKGIVMDYLIFLNIFLFISQYRPTKRWGLIIMLTVVYGIGLIDVFRRRHDKD